MDPVTLSLLIGGGTALAKAGVGAYQASKGRKLAKGAVRPTYETPSAVQDYLNNAKAMAGSTTLPGQGLIEQKIGASTASGIRAAEQGASSSAGLMSTIAGLKGNEQGALADVGIAGAEFGDRNQQRLQEALLKYGSYQDKAFDINKQQPFIDKATAGGAMAGAGLQNLMAGAEQLGGLGQIAASNAGGKVVTPPAASNTPFGASSATSRLGMGDAATSLGRQSNTQKYLSAKKRGFGGSYTDWITSQSLGSGLNFSNMTV